MRRLPRILVCLALVALSGAAAREDGEREFKECPECPTMLGIPGGAFAMGSPDMEAGRFDTEGPVHRVAVKAFALGKYAITSQEFLGFLKDTGYQPEPCNRTHNMGWRSPGGGAAFAPGSGISEPPRWPAVCLDWKDAQAYVGWLNKKVREARPALADRSDGPYRLPSEAEWEYAARAGTTTARWWGDALGRNHANCNGCGSRYDYRLLADVDVFPPNGFGLYGMLGNAWQWTADCWHESYAGAPADGSAWMDGDCGKHVIRGGSWSNIPVFVRSAARSGSAPNGKEFDFSSLSGFRIARDLP